MSAVTTRKGVIRDVDADAMTALHAEMAARRAKATDDCAALRSPAGIR